MKPSPGRIVHYKLTDWDARDINRRRRDFTAYTRSHPRPGEPGIPGASGHVGHYGNPVSAGEIYPAVITRVWGTDPDDSVNLQVFLDGNDIFWATSRHEGPRHGEWQQPEFIPEPPFKPVPVRDMLQAAINLK